MRRQKANLFVNGTAALEMRQVENRFGPVRILLFPGQQPAQPRHSRESLRRPAQTRFRSRVLDASEMCCSLRYEDMGGCPYHVFTSWQIAAFSACSSAIAAIALLLGA